MSMPVAHHTLHLVDLDAEAAGAVLGLPGADGWDVRRWSDLASLVAFVRDEASPPRLYVAVAVASSDEVDVAELRAIAMSARRVDLLVVIRSLAADAHRDLIKCGIGRVEGLPLVPHRLEVMFSDRAYFGSLFPGELRGQRHERLTFRLASCTENVPALVRLLCERCDELGHPNDFVRSQLPLVVDEALTNAMKHGNGWDAARPVRVTAELSPETVEIVVTDEGEGFVRGDVHDPLRADRRGRAGGRGIFLMESLMDEVRYEDGGRTVVLRKRVRHGGVPVLSD